MVEGEEEVRVEEEEVVVEEVSEQEEVSREQEDVWEEEVGKEEVAKVEVAKVDVKEETKEEVIKEEMQSTRGETKAGATEEAMKAEATEVSTKVEATEELMKEEEEGIGRVNNSSTLRRNHLLVLEEIRSWSLRENSLCLPTCERSLRRSRFTRKRSQNKRPCRVIRSILKRVLSTAMRVMLAMGEGEVVVVEAVAEVTGDTKEKEEMRAVTNSNSDRSLFM